MRSGGKRYGLVGKKLGHSYSPFLHRMIGGYDYSLFELEAGELEPFIRGFGDGGLNVTIPYKKAVLSLCDNLSTAARIIRSVNTLVIKDGIISGYNTDYDGFGFLLRLSGIDTSGKKVMVLGSGGASLTVCYALKELGVREIVVVSRGGEDNYSNLCRHSDTELIINTTPVGMYPDNGGCPIDIDDFPSCEGVIDLIYNPLRTRLMQNAGQRGIKTAGGLPMLVSQAAAASSLFMGREVTEEKTRGALCQLRDAVENIVLIGMPGCGKSSIGRALSEISGRELIDTDELVKVLSGREAAEIIKSDGESVFRNLESRAVNTAAKKSGVIIATGGGAVMNMDNKRSLSANGRLYYISRSLRLLETAGRPLSADLPALYEKRQPVYRESADAEIENDASPEDAAKRILDLHRY